MRVLLSLGAAAAFFAAIFVARIVLHGFTAHGHLDAFHLVVALVSASLALVLLRRAFLIQRP